MSLSVAGEVAEIVKADAASCLRYFYGVVFGGHKFLDKLDLKSEWHLLFSIRFFVYMNALCDVLRLPALASLGITQDDLAYFIADFLDEAVTWLFYSTSVHIAFRLVGGRAQWRETLLATLFMSA